MSRLDESDRVTSGELTTALAAYGSAFPEARLPFVQIRALPITDRDEPRCFAYLTDSNEWLAADDDERREIVAAIPGATVVIASAV